MKLLKKKIAKMLKIIRCWIIFKNLSYFDWMKIVLHLKKKKKMMKLKCNEKIKKTNKVYKKKQKLFRHF